MKLATTRLLLIAWLVATIAPAPIVAAAFDINVDDQTGKTTNLGFPLLIWVAGFIVQLFLFIKITRSNSGAKMIVVAWLVASLLPWVCDWTTPVALWAAVPCAVLALGVAAIVYLPLVRTADLSAHGVPATGTVLQVIEPHMNVVINDVYIKRKVRMRIERTDGTPPYEGVLDGLYMLGNIPNVGDRFSLRVDPNKPQHFEALDADTSAPTTTSTNVRVPDSTPDYQEDESVATQLERLVKLHASGGLSDQEFAAAKKRVIGT